MSNNLEWKKLKAEFGYEKDKGKSEFIDRYAKSLVQLKEKGQDNSIIKFLTYESSLNTIHKFWYGDLDEEEFKVEYEKLWNWFNLDTSGQSKWEVIWDFVGILEGSIHKSRLPKEAEDHQLITKIYYELKQLKQHSASLAFEKVLIITQTGNSRNINEALISMLEKYNEDYFLFDDDIHISNFSMLDNLIKSSKKTLLIVSNHNIESTNNFLNSFLHDNSENTKNKVDFLVTDNNYSPSNIQNIIDLSSGDIDKEVERKLPIRIVPSYRLIGNPINIETPEILNINFPYDSINRSHFGRNKELDFLNKSLSQPDINTIAFIADGGVGKTSLISNWLIELEKSNFLGFEKIILVSFYSQGAERRLNTTSYFLDEAMKYLELNSITNSSWEKGRIVGKALGKKNSLIVLDGLEPLQDYDTYSKGKIRDSGLLSMLISLTKSSLGKCIITSRLSLPELKRFGNKYFEKSLEQISTSTGVKILKNNRIKGIERDLESAVVDFGNHALTISLLSNWLYYHGQKDISSIENFETQSTVQETTRNASIILRLFYNYYKADQKVLNVLISLGLFNKPIEKSILKLTLERDNIDSELIELRRKGLIYEESRNNDELVDCHPIVREYFDSVLDSDFHDKKKIYNTKLYKYYASVPSQKYPNSLNDLQPLFYAVEHACKAGDYVDAEKELHFDRINRKEKYYLTKSLGAFGIKLSIISWFFEKLWSKPVSNLDLSTRALLISDAGFYMRAYLGDYKRAENLINFGIQFHIEDKNYDEVIHNYTNLSEILLLQGNIKESITESNNGLELTSNCKSTFQEEILLGSLANSLRLIGNTEKALSYFKKAEDLQRIRSEKEFLYSLRGYLYCELLLDTNKIDEVIKRAIHGLRIGTENNRLLSMGLYNLILGKTYTKMFLIEQNDENRNLCNKHLSEAVYNLQEASIIDHIPRALTARARFYLLNNEYELAKDDIETCEDIVESYEMLIQRVDFYIVKASLMKKLNIINESNRVLKQANAIINKIKYFNKIEDIAEIENMGT